jgi:hypothetical protein
MFQWVVARSEHRDLLARAAQSALRGGELVMAHFAYTGKKPGKPVVIAWTQGARAARAPRWPEVLADWRDIYEEELFPSDEAPVLGEDVSGLGAEACAIHAAPGLAHATVAWYAKGALSAYEHVGEATVAWTPSEGLGRPAEGTARDVVASAGQKLASRDSDVALFERMELTSRAVGENIVRRALLRLLDVDPPAPDALAGLVTRAPQTRVRGG